MADRFMKGEALLCDSMYQYQCSATLTDRDDYGLRWWGLADSIRAIQRTWHDLIECSKT